MDKDKVLEYMLANERERYASSKELYKTVRHIAISIIICLTLLICCYVYFVVPVEEETSIADNGSQVVVHSTVAGDNTNGL